MKKFFATFLGSPILPLAEGHPEKTKRCSHPSSVLTLLTGKGCEEMPCLGDASWFLLPFDEGVTFADSKKGLRQCLIP